MSVEPQVPSSIHREMTLEEFESFPRRQGWKHEYLDGEIHVTPAHVIVPLYLNLGRHHRAQAPRSDAILRPAREEDYPRLIDLFVAAFTPTMGFVDYRPGKVRDVPTLFT